MHLILEELNDDLAQLIVSLEQIESNEPISVARDLWSAPGVTRDELVKNVKDVIALIHDQGADQFATGETLISDYSRRLTFLRTYTVPHLWSENGGQAISAFMLTMQGLRDALEVALPKNQDLTAAIAQERATAKNTAKSLRALEAVIAALEPRSKTLADMLNRIEKANEAADQLPVDLEALREARHTIDELLEATSLDRSKVGTFVKAADADNVILSARVKEADDIVARCSEAYAASTSHGLAAAFTERSASLGKSMWVWVGGLVIALGLGSWIGANQLRNFSESIRQPDSNTTVAVINLVLALLSVGATVWFAWLSTKQIGQRFRLAEDYAFKASVSRAYEGYRREAANIDQAFVSRLFASALSRLDEQPLRLVETTTHGSPWHELGSSELLRKASESIPGFVASVNEFAKDRLATLKKTSSNAEVAPKATSDIE